jgi:hypothetical protein
MILNARNVDDLDAVLAPAMQLSTVMEQEARRMYGDLETASNADYKQVLNDCYEEEVDLKKAASKEEVISKEVASVAKMLSGFGIFHHSLKWHLQDIGHDLIAFANDIETLRKIKEKNKGSQHSMETELYQKAMTIYNTLPHKLRVLIEGFERGERLFLDVNKELIGWVGLKIEGERALKKLARDLYPGKNENALEGIETDLQSACFKTGDRFTLISTEFASKRKILQTVVQNLEHIEFLDLLTKAAMVDRKDDQKDAWRILADVVNSIEETIKDLDRQIINIVQQLDQYTNLRREVRYFDEKTLHAISYILNATRKKLATASH